MPDPFRQVNQGEELVIPAVAWNQMLRVAASSVSPSFDSSQQILQSFNEILVQNDSGVDLDRFGVLAIDNPLITPTANENEFLSRVLISGVAVAAENKADFVYALEPIPNGKIGRCMIRGEVTGTIKVRDVRHRFATPVVGSAVLESSSVGPVRLHWVESSAGDDKRAVMSIDHVQHSVLAVITAAVSIGSNRWEYSWAEVEINDGDFTQLTGGANSTTNGKAYNLLEAPNDSSGVQGNGLDIGNLLGTFAIKPIGVGAVIPLTGPHTYTDASNNWFFSANNIVDGACPA